MVLTKGDNKTPNEELFNKIQKVYSEYFKPETEYKRGSFKYTNAPNYGYVDFEKREFYGKRELLLMIISFGGNKNECNLV